MNEIGVKAGQDYHGEALGVTAERDGAQLRCEFQKMSGRIGRQGLWITSTASESEGSRFRLAAAEVGRGDIAGKRLARSGLVSVTDSVVRWERPNVTEEYSVSVDGVRQDFLINSRPHGQGPLRVDLELTGARAEMAAYGSKVVFEGSTRALAYSRLRVLDAKGRELPAQLGVSSPNRIAVRVRDENAVYPLRIDPTFSDANWISLSSNYPGADGIVYAAVGDGNGNLYIGGNFGAVGGVAAKNIAKWNGATWSALGSGTNYTVNALAVNGSLLYVGGQFSSAGGVSANYVAQWNGSSWAALGGGMNFSVLSLAVMSGNLYAGGGFTTADGITVNGIAKWNGSSWSALGAGMNNGISGYNVNALAVSDTTLYAGGSFTKAGGVTVNNIASWNGSGWSALSSGTPGTVNALAVMGSTLYAGGSFTQVGGVSAANVAQWNGSAWSALGTGTQGSNSTVWSLLTSGTTLYVGGAFSTVAGTTVNGIASWNGSSWSTMGTGINGSFPGPQVYALAINGTSVYAGGQFNGAGGVTAKNLAQWNGSGWSGFGTGFDGAVSCMAVSGANLYVGGSFTVAGTVAANNVAQWNGTTWSALGPGTNGQVSALAVIGSTLYAGGTFTQAGGVSAASLAQWNGSAWSSVGSGTNGNVNALAVSGTNLYVGGSFSTAGAVSVSDIALWNGSAWSGLGSGISGSVYALALSGSTLYAGGQFTQAGGISAASIAQWNGSAWSALGSGTSGRISALAVNGSTLYAGGSFTTIGGVSAGCIAAWNGGSWSALSSGMGGGSVSALACVGSNVYAGGNFYSAGGTSITFLAYWDGGAWSALGSGVDNPVGAIIPTGGALPSLYVGGAFGAAGTQVSPSVAQVNVAFPAVTTLAVTGVTTTGATLNGTVNASTFSTSVSFDYGTSVSYGTTVTGTPSPVTGSTDTPVSASLSSLTPNKTYHFRVKGTNSTGTANGNDVFFTTPNNVATLSGLTLSNCTLSPSFFLNTTSYTTTAPPGDPSVIVTPMATDGAASITVNGTPINSGSASAPINLSLGSNTITVVVTATDGVTKKTYTVAVTASAAVPLSATFNSPTDVPVTASSYFAANNTVSFALNCAVPVGTNLTVVNNTGLNFIQGMFSNLAQGQPVTLSYQGNQYKFVANYFGGTGNDLVLQWAGNRLIGWGDNDLGQLGNNSTLQTNLPVPVSSTGVLAGKTITAIAAGSTHSLALCSDGTLAAWGGNNVGQLGNGLSNNSSVPVLVSTNTALSGKTVVAIAVASSHNVVLCSDGTVVTWGYGVDGELGNGTNANSNVPVAVSTSGTALAGKTVVAVGTGDFFSEALCSDGTVVTWGYNASGQLGNATTTASNVAVAVSTSGVLSGKTVTKIVVSSASTLAQCSNGTLVSWGANGWGELGNGNFTSSSVPVTVNVSSGSALFGKTVTGFAAGQDHFMALCSDGSLASWGFNQDGQLGNNTTSSSALPVSVITSGTALAGKTPAAVSAGQLQGVVLCTDGTVASWGYGGDGMLGNGSNTEVHLAVAADLSSLAAGERIVLLGGQNSAEHNLALVAGPLSPPQIAVQQPAGTNLSSGSSTVSFGSTSVGVGVPLTFTILNNGASGSSGSVGLQISNVTVDGVNASDFAVTTTPASAVSAGSSTTMVVTFTPTASINRNAVLHITSNDPNTGVFNVNLVGTCPGTLAATYNSSTDVPLTASSFTATGSTVNLTLNYAPATGTNLTVVKNTGVAFIAGTFTNLTQGQLVTLGYNGFNYTFVVNYFGGTGNDLVLQWASNRLLAWGYNSNQQLGYTGPNSSVPTAVGGGPFNTSPGKAIIAAGAGASHSVILYSDGTMYAWGDNVSYQLGNGTITGGPTPVAVTSAIGSALYGKTPIALSVGSFSNLALCSDGTIAAWGSNVNGQLGNNSTVSSGIPLVVNTAAGSALAGKQVVAVSTGGSHSLALCSDGTVAAWGFNGNGQLGNASTNQSLVPVAVNTSSGSALFGKTVVAIAAGSQHSVALCSDGTVASWGYGYDGELGNGTFGAVSVPVAVSTAAGSALSGKTVVSVAAGQYHNIALCSDGMVAAWGSNSYGQLGNNSTTGSSTPVATNTAAGSALSGKTVVSVAAGQTHSLASCADGTVTTWGNGASGRLGNNSLATSTVPVAVNTAALAPGENFVLAVTDSGSSHNLAAAADPPEPQLTVQQPNGSLRNMGTTDFGATSVGAGTAIPFTISNNGTAPLTISQVNVTGVNSGDFAVTTAPDSSVAVGSNTTLVITFTPSALFHGSAFLSFTTNDPLNSIFTQNLRGSSPGTLNATFNSPTDVPLTATGFNAVGSTVNFTLNSALATGTNLTVVKHGGLGFIQGTFDNLAQGQSVALNYNGTTYNFVANYYGGDGNDLVLQWANVRPVAWGLGISGQIGNNSSSSSQVPTSTISSGVLSGKSILSMSAGGMHTLAICSDGTIAAWGYGIDGELGNGNNASSFVPTSPVTGLFANHTVIAVSAGYRHSLVLCSDGTLATWGYGANGQLGNNTTSSNNIPTLVSPPAVPLGVTAVAISAGNSHNMVLCSDGSVWAWGLNSSGQLGNNTTTTNSSVPMLVNQAGNALAGKNVVAISAGTSHSLALCSDGTVVAWGDNSSGELGNNSTTQSSVPVAVSTIGTALDGKNVVAIAAGNTFSLALCSDGTLASWGNNLSGQLGNGSSNNSSSPVSVIQTGLLFGKTVLTIAGGNGHCVARCSDGTIAAWGLDASGQLGNNSTLNAFAPVGTTNNLKPGEFFTAATTGPTASHSLAIVAEPPLPQIAVQQPAGTGLANGSTVSFGSSPVGTGVPLTFTILNSGTAPLTISGVTFDGDNPADYVVTTPSASLLSAGASTTLVVTCTPAASFNRTAAMHIGSNDPNAPSFNLQLITNNPGTLTAAYNSASDVPLTAKGCSVSGSSVNLSLNFAPGTGTPLTIINNTSQNVIQGAFSNLAQGQLVTLTYGGINYNYVANYFGGNGNDLVLQWANSYAAAWGANGSGQLGNGTISSSNVPVTVIPNTLLSSKTVLSTTAGGSHSLALCSDGTIAAWGNNGSGQLGNGIFTSQSLSPVAVTSAGTPLAGKTVIALSAGNLHSLALCSNGTVVAWGNNGNGQLGNNSSANSNVPVSISPSVVLSGKTIIAIAAGGSHSMALCSDGTLAAWGLGSSGQLGNGGTGGSLVPIGVTMTGALFGKTVNAIAAGSSHCLALCSDGTVVAWGAGSNGQLGNGGTSSSLTPVNVSVTSTPLSGRTVVAIAAGGNHSLALCSDGTLVAWGAGTSGQLGNGGNANSSVPVAVTIAGTPLAGRTIVSIAGGANYSAALCSDGTLASWGLNSGAFGNGSNTASFVPVAMGSGAGLAPGQTVMQFSTCQSAGHDVALIANPTYPVAITQAATAITTTTATLNSQVNCDGNSTHASLQWGLTSSYGSSTINVPMGSFNYFVSLSTNLTGLSPHTIYHFRVTANNAAGTANGADRTFTTLNNAPVATPVTVNNVGGPVAIPVLSNASDPDSDSLTVSGVTQGANGAVTTDGNTVTYTPGAHFSTSDTFLYTVSDGFGGTASASVTVNAAPVQTWRVQTFGANSNNPSIAGDNADANGNGIPNLMEYALHGDAIGGSTGSSILPQASTNSTTGAMQLSFTRYRDRSDITLIVQACDSLSGPWINLAQSMGGGPFSVSTTGASVTESGSGNAISVTAGDLYPMNDPAHSHRFLRLQVTRP